MAARVGYLCIQGRSLAPLPDNTEEVCAELHDHFVNGNVEAVARLITTHKLSPDLVVEPLRRMTLLHFLCEKGYLDVVRNLANHSEFNASMRNKLGITPLMLAAEKGHFALVIFLCQHRKTDLSTLDNKGRSVLYYACVSQHVPIVNELMHLRNFDPTMIDKRGDSPIQLACFLKNFELLKILVAFGNVPYNCPVENTTLLHWAVIRSVEVVELLVKQAAFDPQLRDKMGRLAIELADEQGEIVVVKVLASHKRFDPMSFKNFLAFCCRTGWLEKLRELLKTGQILPLLKQDAQINPLHIACLNGHAEVAKFIILHLAIPAKEVDVEGNNAWHFACANGNVAVLEVLQKHGLVDAAKALNNEGREPFHCACLAKNVDAVKFLLINQYYSWKRDKKGATPLHDACKSGNVAIIRELVKYQAFDQTVIDNEGRTPLFLAAEWGKLEVVKELAAQVGYNPFYPNNNQILPIVRASQCGHKLVVKELAGPICERIVKDLFTVDIDQVPLIQAAYAKDVDKILHWIEIIANQIKLSIQFSSSKECESFSLLKDINIIICQIHEIFMEYWDKQAKEKKIFKEQNQKALDGIGLYMVHIIVQVLEKKEEPFGVSKLNKKQNEIAKVLTAMLTEATASALLRDF